MNFPGKFKHEHPRNNLGQPTVFYITENFIMQRAKMQAMNTKDTDCLKLYNTPKLDEKHIR